MAKSERVFKNSNLQDKAPRALFMTAGIKDVTSQLMMKKKFSKTTAVSGTGVRDQRKAVNRIKRLGKQEQMARVEMRRLMSQPARGSRMMEPPWKPWR